MLKKVISSIFILLFVVQSSFTQAEYTEADLPIVDGKIYHLSITAEQLAQNIILVGDPDRVPVLADYCLQKEGRVDVAHRGLRVTTGKTEKNISVSIVTTGMGTPSAEVVLNELVALNDIDLKTREKRTKPLYEKLNVIRLGTSGALQASTVLGTPIITEYTVGLDNTGLFYDAKNTDKKITDLEKQCKKKIDNATDKKSRFYGKITPYAAAASPEVVTALKQAAAEDNVTVAKGITISNSGFFANQGRDVSDVSLTVPNIDNIFSDITVDGVKVENMEMEASFICYFMGALGHRVGAVCPAICNRCSNTFAENYEAQVLISLKMILKAFEKLQD